MKMGHEEILGGGVEERISVSDSDPIVFELNRLQNQLKEKDRELKRAHGEIKALRDTDAYKDKAVEELRNEVNKMDKKFGASEDLLDHKNLEIEKLRNEKKDAVAAQFAAEATLRRVYTSQKDDGYVPLDSFIAPLEAEIKLQKNQIAALQEDYKALERHTKSKENALLEAEIILKSALERALVVEDVQNQNFELKRQIEIFQEENRVLEKTNRQKVLEVQKLSQTIHELEEAILAGGAASNVVRDYQRQISEINEEKRTLERELARLKVSANRVATVVANEWKDENDKVMPVKQWLEERRVLQAEIHRLKEKLAISERTAKAEAQLKEKLKLRLKTLEDSLKHELSLSYNADTVIGSVEQNNILGFLMGNTGLKRRFTSQPRVSIFDKTSPFHQSNAENEINSAAKEMKRVGSLKKKYAYEENMMKKGMWASRSKVADNSGKENTEMKANMDVNIDKCNDDTIAREYNMEGAVNEDLPNKGFAGSNNNEDTISSFLYDRLQKEVISLRKSCQVKEESLNTKEDEIKILVKKIETLTKVVEAESRRVKRETTREKETQSARMDNNKDRRMNSSKRVTAKAS